MTDPLRLGRYSLFARLASGGMATVYLGRLHSDVGFGRTVAIKRLHPHLAAEPEFVSMFLDEARLAARVSHPNVVTIVDVVAADGELFLVMEYVRGEPLGALIRATAGAERTIPVPIVTACAIGFLAGLHAAHEATDEQGRPLSIVHRDISPQNIFVGADGVARVLDFGVAKAAMRLQTTRDGRLKGKLPYMAPEQLGGTVSRRTDIYSAGAVLWEALTCRRLFTAGSQAQLLRVVRQADVPPPSRWNPEVPPALDRVAQKALAKDPEERYATCAQMARDLDAALRPASTYEVGDWVTALAGERLAERTELVAEIESGSIPVSGRQELRRILGARPSVPPPTVRADAPREPPSPASEDLETLPEGVAAEPERRGLGPLPQAADVRTSAVSSLARAEPGARPSKGRALLAVALLAPTLVVLTVVAAGALRARAVAPAPSPASSSSAPPVAVTRIVDLPPPRTSVPAAAVAFASGIQAMHDDNWWEAQRHFAKAVELDPSMAAGHLRLSLALGPTAAGRAAFREAVGLRAQLGERDQALMEAVQPLRQQETIDPAETDRRLRALAARYPGDVEILMWLGLAHLDNPDALPIAERALALDPADGQSWETKGRALLVAGRVEEARAAFARCSEISVDGTDCFRWLGRTDSLDGRCTDYERDARSATDRAPEALPSLLAARASTGASDQALSETLGQWAPKAPASSPEVERLGFAARLAILAGDFARAARLAERESAIVAADPELRASYVARYTETLELVDVALETGDERAVRRLAADFVARSGAWVSRTRDVDLSLYLARLAFPREESAPPAFETARREWVDRRIAAGAYRGDVWSYAYAAAAFTPAEAAAALVALGELGPPTPRAGETHVGLSRAGSPEGDLGRVYRLAGRVDEAVPHLRRAAAACDVLSSTLDHVRASLDLGRALEQQGDHDGACDAYAKVLARWGQATPRSVTASAARERRKALRCLPR